MKGTKVILGSGKNCPNGWKCYDKDPKVLLSKFPHLKYIFHKIGLISKDVYDEEWSPKIKYRDIRNRLPFDSRTVDYVYSSHLLEHLTREETKSLCKEVHRILKKDGVFRVVVPDLYKAVLNYQQNNIEYFGGTMDKPIADQLLDYMMLGTFHKWMYDASSLRRLLLDSGFDITEEYWFRFGKMVDLDKIENHHRRSIYVEAYKK